MQERARGNEPPKCMRPSSNGPTLDRGVGRRPHETVELVHVLRALVRQCACAAVWRTNRVRDNRPSARCTVDICSSHRRWQIEECVLRKKADRTRSHTMCANKYSYACVDIHVVKNESVPLDRARASQRCPAGGGGGIMGTHHTRAVRFRSRSTRAGGYLSACVGEQKE